MFLIRGSNKLSEAYQKLIRAKMFLIRILIRGLSEDGITKKPLEVEHPGLSQLCAILQLHLSVEVWFAGKVPLTTVGSGDKRCKLTRATARCSKRCDTKGYKIQGLDYTIKIFYQYSVGFNDLALSNKQLSKSNHYRPQLSVSSEDQFVKVGIIGDYRESDTKTGAVRFILIRWSQDRF